MSIEETERAADDQRTAKGVPSQSADEERPHVLDGLRSEEKPFRCFVKLAWIVGNAAIDQANRAADGFGVGMREKWCDELQKRVRCHDRIRVDRTHKIARSDVQCDVERIRLSRVVFVHHDEARFDLRSLNRANMGRFELAAIRRENR